MTSNELRKKYLRFFEEKGHVVIPSSSIIPENDPSVLFTTAGMHPLVPYLLGESHPQGKRLVNFQKCLRTGDIDEVGDKTHLTFFEMLGNWSLGDYFKEDSIKWSFEFLTDPKWLGLDINMLAISVFAGDNDAEKDNESVQLWKDLGIPEERIAYLTKEDNWWPAGGNNLGPQGPDTEIFYWTGLAEEVPEKFDPDDSGWVEIWNNVFIQFNRLADGRLEPLKQKNVDTGMGLERTAAVLQGVDNVFETELFQSIINNIEKLSDRPYGADTDEGYSMRIIADHLRASVFVLGDDQGVVPSNVDQGYILRRLIRRTVRHGRLLGIESSFTDKLAKIVIDEYKSVYPELSKNKKRILDELKKEEEKFRSTLEKGLKEFEKRFKRNSSISGEDAFVLYSSYGFPLEISEELARDQGQEIDKAVFEKEFKKHQDLSRVGAGQKFAGGLADHDMKTVRLHTATHLLHQALRMVLGEHVAQKGSNITQERLRFDFSHSEKVTKEQLKEIESIVNVVIKDDLPVHFEILDIGEAKKSGAIGIFDDKYAQLGGKVKVYFVGDFSKEVCGGPHVEHTSELGCFRIKKEEASSSGIRRIKAVLE